MGFDDAAKLKNWSAQHRERMKMLLNSNSTEYMSSEYSSEEETDDAVGSRSILKVKKIVWLKKKYRDGLHHVDSAYLHIIHIFNSDENMIFPLYISVLSVERWPVSLVVDKI